MLWWRDKRERELCQPKGWIGEEEKASTSGVKTRESKRLMAGSKNRWCMNGGLGWGGRRGILGVG